MDPSRRRWAGRLVVGSVLLVVGLIVLVVLYWAVGLAGMPVAPPEPQGEPVRLRRTAYALAVLLVALLLVLLFVVGAYLSLRLGRLVVEHRVGGKPTPYFDAWSQYRLTDDQIAEATREPDEPDNLGGERADA